MNLLRGKLLCQSGTFSDIPFWNIEETETLAFTYDRLFHMSQIHIKLPMNQTEPSGKM